MEKRGWNKLLILGIFAAAMAFLEAVIVIYLRKLFYPEGFSFPLKGFIEPAILNIEWLREIATIVMLLAVAILAGRKFYDRFAYFIYSFAVWDIFYYVWLKASLGWPSSLTEWDILFLIPWAWVGPIIAPIIVSATLIVFAYFILKADEIKTVKLNFREWALMIIGFIAILFTFLYDYGKLVLTNKFTELYTYIPAHYSWTLFIIGEILVIASIISFYIRNRTKH